MSKLIPILVLAFAVPSLGQNCRPCNCHDQNNEVTAWCDNRRLQVVPDLGSWNSRMVTFNLSGHNISEIQSRSFAPLPRLTILDLRRGSIRLIYTRAFVNMPALLRLYLSNNRIDEIDNSAFDGSANLTRLYLSHNEIATIQPQTFRPLVRLVHLELSYNHIAYLDLGMFPTPAKVSSAFILLTDNQWNCECNLRPFVSEFLRSPHVDDYDMVPVCGSPGHKRGVRWNHADFCTQQPWWPLIWRIFALIVLGLLVLYLVYLNLWLVFSRYYRPDISRKPKKQTTQISQKTQKADI